MVGVVGGRWGWWVVGAGCWVLGAGCWVLGAGVLGAGCWAVCARCAGGVRQVCGRCAAGVRSSEEKITCQTFEPFLVVVMWFCVGVSNLARLSR